MDLFIMDIMEDTVVDGPGFRTTIYAAGCRHHCVGCHNPQSWNRTNGYKMKVADIVAQLLDDPFSNVTFSGGDPLEQVEGFIELARQIKSKSDKSIWCYTGYRYEEIISSARLSAILPYLDVLVDGRFEHMQRDSDLLFRGSCNQRLIDVPGSLIHEELCLYSYNPYVAN